MGLRNCTVDNNHQIPGHLRTCPYCEAQMQRQKAQPAAQAPARPAAAKPTSAPIRSHTPGPARGPVSTSAPVSASTVARLQPPRVIPLPAPPRREGVRIFAAVTIVGALILGVGAFLTRSRTDAGTTTSANQMPACGDVSAQALATDTAPDSVDAAGSPVSYPASNLLDGDPSTAWRVSGSGVGETITITFGQDCLLSRIGLLNGYHKIDPSDGTDRWTENRRVSAADWQFGSESHLQQFDVNDLSDGGETLILSSTVISSLTFTIIDSAPEGTRRDFTAISEVLIS